MTHSTTLLLLLLLLLLELHTCCRRVATWRSRVLMYSSAGIVWGPA